MVIRAPVSTMENTSALPSQLEVTTVQDQSNGDTRNSSLPADSIQGITIITIQAIIMACTFLGNLLMIHLLYSIPNLKLRKSTKLLLCYLCCSYCIGCILVVGRLFINCVVMLLTVLNLSIHIISSILFLALEIFVMVKKPHRHYRFVSKRICMVGILISCLISIGVDVVAYINMKEPEDKVICYLTNGTFNPIVLCVCSSSFWVMFIVAATIQILTLKEIKKAFPGIQNITNNVMTIQVISVPSVGPEVTRSENRTKSPLLKLMKILLVSLCCSIICWTPSFVSIFTFSLSEIFGIRIHLERQIVVVSGGLASLNGLIHVIVYFSMSSQLKQAAIRFLKNLTCQN